MTKHSKPADAYHPWSTYIDAREEARRGGDRKVGTEHLILGLLREPVLARALGCDLQTARDALEAHHRYRSTSRSTSVEADAQSRRAGPFANDTRSQDRTTPISSKLLRVRSSFITTERPHSGVPAPPLRRC